MPSFFDIKQIFFTLWNYPISHLEFWATLSGGLAVYLSAKENVWSWLIGLVNVSLGFIMFYQIQLYPDMLLQVFFFVTNIAGFYAWKFPKEINANQKNQLKITKLAGNATLIILALIIMGTLILGSFSSKLHLLLPKIFSQPGAFPYLDSFTTVGSILATFLLIRKKIEAWWCWLLIDIISTYMYFVKDIKIYAILYFVFCIIAIFAALKWLKIYRHDT
jgi:nicotinamide mononucleotide transporter